MTFVYLPSKFHTCHFIELLVKFGVTGFLDFQNLLGPCLHMTKAVMLTQLGAVSDFFTFCTMIVEIEDFQNNADVTHNF
jgi:hypothetical protein